MVFYEKRRLLFFPRDVESKFKEPYVNNDKDTFLTLEILAAILEKLSKSGKSMQDSNSRSLNCNFS